MCGATEGGLSLDGVNVAKEAVVQGQVTRAGEPVGNAYVRLLDRTGEFTAEVPTSATATSGSSPARASGRCAPWPRRPSPWTRKVDAAVGSVAEVAIAI